MQVTAALCVILFATAEACHSKAYPPKTGVKKIGGLATEETSNEGIKTEDNENEGITTVKSATKKNGNIYIADCYLSAMKPGELKTKILSIRDTEFDNDMPMNQNLYVNDSNSATEQLPQRVFINNIDRYNVTIQNGQSCDSVSINTECLTKRIRIVEIKAKDVFRKVEKGNVPPYTIMGENWSIYITDCNLDNIASVESIIYIRDGDSAIEGLPKQMTILNSKRYNIEILSVNDYDHCVIADAPCWPKETRILEIISIE